MTPRRPRTTTQPQLVRLEDRLAPIVSGFPIGDQTWHAVGLVTYFNEFTQEPSRCTGTLIRPQWVLTAAHCVATSWTEIIYFQVGGLSSQKVQASARIANVPEGGGENPYDLALIRLKDSVQSVTPLALYTGRPTVGQSITLVGFGMGGTGDTGAVQDPAPTKRGGSADIDEVDADGVRFWRRFEQGESQTAKGDSGGPNIIRVDNQYYVLGVTSSGEENVRYGSRAYSVRIDTFVGWINSVISWYEGGSQGTQPRGIIAYDRNILNPGTTDTTPPVLNGLPSPTAILSDPFGAAVWYSPVLAEDDYDLQPAVSYSHPSGSIFPVGTTPVTATATDASGNSRSATFPVTVLPLVVADDYETDEDIALTVAAPGVLANDIVQSGAAHQVVLVAAPQHGQVTLNPDGSFVYVPQHNFNSMDWKTGEIIQPDQFRYKVLQNGVESPVATVQITVLPVKDPPLAGDDTFTVAEGGTVVIDSGPVSEPRDPGPPIGGSSEPNFGGGGQPTPHPERRLAGILKNDADPDQPQYEVFYHPLFVVARFLLTWEVVTGPMHGTLTWSSSGRVTYTPAAGFRGVDTFTYRALDGELSSNVATVTLRLGDPGGSTVSAGDDAYLLAGNAPLTVAAPGVLANDQDAAGGVLTAFLVESPVHGTLQLNADGSFTFTPGANFPGSDRFIYQAVAGQESSAPVVVTLTLNLVNNPPTAAPDFYELAEDTSFLVIEPGVLLNDQDQDGDPLTSVLVSGPMHGQLILDANGSFRYTPDPNFHGQDSFTYRADDGTSSSAPVTVFLTVRPVNDVPETVPDAYSLAEDEVLTVAAPGVLANDRDADGDALTAELLSQPLHGALTWIGGAFQYRPAANFHGADSFTYRAWDGSGPGEAATVLLTVTSVNDRPEANADAYQITSNTELKVGAATGVLVLGFAKGPG